MRGVARDRLASSALPRGGSIRRAVTVYFTTEFTLRSSHQVGSPEVGGIASSVFHGGRVHLAAALAAEGLDSARLYWLWSLFMSSTCCTHARTTYLGLMRSDAPQALVAFGRRLGSGGR